MEVILKEDVNKLGHRGDVVKVADGYGRNYLLPGKLAKERVVAEELQGKLDAVELVFERKVGENEQLFGSVTSADIAHQLEEKGFTIDRRKIALEEPLRSLGEFHVPVKLHREVTSHVKVTVKGDQPEGAETAA